MNDVGVQNKHKQSNQSRSAFRTLESVIRQAESLSPTERLSLWQHLAQLPDSGIESTPDVRPLIRDHWMCLKTTSTSPPQDQEWEQLGFFGLQRKGNTVIATIDGVEVLRVAFKPKDLRRASFQTLPVKPPTDELKQIGAEKSDADIEAALEQSAQQVQEVVIEAEDPTRQPNERRLSNGLSQLSRYFGRRRPRSRRPILPGDSSNGMRTRFGN